MIQRHKDVSEAFDSFGKSYSQAVNDAVAFSGLSVDFFTRVKADYIMDLVSQEVPDTACSSALDVGCGVGNFHALLAPHFARLAGADVSVESLAIAQSRNPTVGYAAYDGERLPYDDDSFELVFTICVMHHVPPAAWGAFTAEMYRVVRPGGIVLVFEHNPRNPLTTYTVNRCPFDVDAVLLRHETTIELVSCAGFRDVESRFILTVPAANRMLRGVDRIFSKIPLGAQYFVIGKK